MSLKNHISRAVFLLTCHFCFHCVAFELYHFHCPPPPLSLAAPLLPSSNSLPLILGDCGQGLLQFPLLMASPCYCSQTSAVSVPCSWVWNKLLFPQTCGRNHEGTNLFFGRHTSHHVPFSFPIFKLLTVS